MVRFAIIGIVIAVAFTLYAIVDAAMTDALRARGVSKPVWILIVVILPVIGGALWFWLGKGQPVQASPVAPPDDDPSFATGAGGSAQLSDDEIDAHVRELEERLRELDDEVFPGEQPKGGTEPESGPQADPKTDPKADQS